MIFAHVTNTACNPNSLWFNILMASLEGFTEMNSLLYLFPAAAKPCITSSESPQMSLIIVWRVNGVPGFLLYQSPLS